MTQTNLPQQPLSYWRGTHALVLGIISMISIPVVSIVLGIIAITYGHRSRQSFDQVAADQHWPTHPKTGQPVSKGPGRQPAGCWASLPCRWGCYMQPW